VSPLAQNLDRISLQETMDLYSELNGLASPTLRVIARDKLNDQDDNEFVTAITSRAFNARGLSDIKSVAWPEALLIAKTVADVQAVVTFCAHRNLKVCIRSGAHSWYVENWLRGDGTVLLDVGSLDAVEANPKTGAVSVEPGATGTDVLKAVSPNFHFPCGHCPGVPVGGFILGGGYGIGYTKYGLTSTWVSGVDVVLASGEHVKASVDSTDPRDRAICSLIKGTHTGFPGVITKYHIDKLPPCPYPLVGMAIYDIKLWKVALKQALDIQFRGDSDALSIETVVVFSNAPPPLAEATGVYVVAMLSLTVWGDSEEESRSLWSKYTTSIGDTLVPMEDPSLLPPEAVPDMFGPFYPAKAHYETHCHAGNEQVHEMTDDDIEGLVEPIADLWQSTPLPGTSHTLLIPMHPAFKSLAHNGLTTATGQSVSFLVHSYAIHENDSMGPHFKNLLNTAHRKVIESSAFATNMPEGDVAGLGADSGFTKTAFEDVKARISLLDPEGVFAGFATQQK
jgi:hypothetical protein